MIQIKQTTYWRVTLAGLLLLLLPVLACKVGDERSGSGNLVSTSETGVDVEGPFIGGGGLESEEEVPLPESEGFSLAPSVNQFKAYYRRFLGEGYGTPIRTTRKHKIRYYDNGFSPQTDAERRKMSANIAQSVAYLKSKRVPASVIGQFETYANKLVSNPHEIGDQLDYAFDTITYRWNACGGKYAAAANAMARAKANLVVTTQKAPFYICGSNAGSCVYAGGAVMNSQGDIRLMIAYVQKVDTAPANANVMQFDQFARWELGNWFGWAGLGFRPKNLASEIGEKSPCGGAAKFPPVTPPPVTPPPVTPSPPDKHVDPSPATSIPPGTTTKLPLQSATSNGVRYVFAINSGDNRIYYNAVPLTGKAIWVGWKPIPNQSYSTNQAMNLQITPSGSFNISAYIEQLKSFYSITATCSNGACSFSPWLPTVTPPPPDKHVDPSPATSTPPGTTTKLPLQSATSNGVRYVFAINSGDNRIYYNAVPLTGKAIWVGWKPIPNQSYSTNQAMNLQITPSGSFNISAYIEQLKSFYSITATCSNGACSFSPWRAGQK